MNSSNFQSYRNRIRPSDIGGLAKWSLVRLQTPISELWYVAVDMQGLRGTTKSSIRMIPNSLPEIHRQTLSKVPSLVQDRAKQLEFDNELGEYDVLISHASEDKGEVVRPLG